MNCHIPACFTRHPGELDSISSHFLDLSLVRKHLKKDVIFGGKLDSAVGIGYLKCAIARIKSSISDKRGIRLVDIDEIWARNILPSPVQQQQRPRQL